MTTLIDELKEEYGYDTPILLRDIPYDLKDNGSIRSKLSYAVKQGRIVRAIQGVYYFPGKTSDGKKSLLPADSIAYSKYLKDWDGYYSGKSFDYTRGFISEKPAETQITTNNTAQGHKHITINGKKYCLVYPKVMITKENRDILAWLDYITDHNVKDIRVHSEQIKAVLDGAKGLWHILSVYPPRTANKLLSADILSNMIIYRTDKS